MEDTLFQVGDIVKEDGIYVCAPCGYKKSLSKGEKFPECMKCMKDTKGWVKGLEVWEKID